MTGQKHLGALRVTGDGQAASWIAARLTGRTGAVVGTVPDGYPAYARITHPASDAAGVPATWAQVARATGRQAHPLMQWHALVGSPDPFNARGGLWSGARPPTGTLDADVLALLCGVLAAHTTTVHECFFAYWVGYGHIGPALPVPPLPSEVGAYASTAGALHLDHDRPQVHLPGRDHLLATGPLRAALDADQSPSLFWPADRAWCVATEVDFDSTLVAGSRALTSALLGAPGIEAWPIGPQDSLLSDADHLNPLPEPERPAGAPAESQWSSRPSCDVRLPSRAEGRADC